MKKEIKQMSIMTALADSGRTYSLASYLRRARFAKFEVLTNALPKPLHVLDVGGTDVFWERHGWADREDVSITLVNLQAPTQIHRNIVPLVGDATDLSQFADCSFDIAFSNSTIEHLGGVFAQKHMAEEMRRVARRLWIQTPNFWFPMEPHFCVPGWQWLPVSVRVRILQKLRCGWLGPCNTEAEARALVDEIRLMTRNELREMFPRAHMIPERFCGAVKSWIVVEGFQEAP